MPIITTDEAAKRLAKTIMQDIWLYNGDKIKEGIRQDAVFENLADELNEGRKLYMSRVAPEIASRTNYFDRMINDFLIKETIMKSRGTLESKIA